jgi:hypothetical protein
MNKKSWGQAGVFGSTEKRFNRQANTSELSPGPGQYRPDRSIKIMDNKRSEANIKRSSSMFLSTLSRNPYANRTSMNIKLIIIRYGKSSCGLIQLTFIYDSRKFKEEN